MKTTHKYVPTRVPVSYIKTLCNGHSLSTVTEFPDTWVCFCYAHPQMIKWQKRMFLVLGNPFIVVIFSSLFERVRITGIEICIITVWKIDGVQQLMNLPMNPSGRPTEVSPFI